MNKITKANFNKNKLDLYFINKFCAYMYMFLYIYVYI